MALDPEYLVVHTAAYSGRNCDRDMIDRWHRQKGWTPFRTAPSRKGVPSTGPEPT